MALPAAKRRPAIEKLNFAMRFGNGDLFSIVRVY
jgi:hypothetical protein